MIFAPKRGCQNVQLVFEKRSSDFQRVGSDDSSACKAISHDFRTSSEEYSSPANSIHHAKKKIEKTQSQAKFFIITCVDM